MMKKILLGFFFVYGSICIQAEDIIQPDGSVEGPEIRKTLHSLNCSAQYFVEVIADWAESVFVKPGEEAFSSFSYAFYHSVPDIGEITAAQAALNESSIQCAGIPRLSCASLINNEASVGAKGLGEYLVGLLSDINDSEDLLRQITAFGWSPSHGFMNETMDAPTFDPAKADQARIEGGGGSGAGFQLFCDDVLLLSAGGGGGGGVEGQLIHDGNDYSIGGGGGGGTQFRLPERHGGFKRMGDWVSVGGGGGCGTHDQQDEDGSGEHVTGLLCGRQMDADSSDDGRQNMLLNETLTWCRSKGYTIRLAGGGGGGGGTAECCKGYQIGYGFSFQLIAQPPSLPPSPQSLPTPPPAPKSKPSKTSHGHHHEKKQSHGKSKAHRHHHSLYKYLRLDQEMKNVLENGEDKLLPLAAPVAALAFAGQQHQQGGAVPQSIEQPENGDEEVHLLAAPAGVVPGPPEGGAIPQDAIDAQLKYDPLFAYLYNASKTCEGGFQDWCCVCKNAKRLLRNSTDERFIWFQDVTCCRDEEKEEQATDDGALNGTKPNDDWHSSATTHTWRPEDDTPIFKPPAPLSQCHLVLQGGRVTLVPWGQEEEEAESSSSFQSSSSLLEEEDEEAAIITLPRLGKSKSNRSSPIEFEKAARRSLGGGGESAPFPGTWWGMLVVITAAFMYLIRGSEVAASLGRRSIPNNIFLRMRRRSVRGQEGEGEEEEAVDERSSMMILMRSYQSAAAARGDGDDEKEGENRLYNSADSRKVGYGTI